MDTLGKMRYRIQLALPLTGRDNLYGGETKTWIYSDPIFAARQYTPAGSDEQKQAFQITQVTACLFTIRYRTGISAMMRIVYDELEYRIKSVLPTEQNEFLILETEQIGRWRSPAWVDPDGQTWIDPDGNAWIWQPGSDSEGYRAPGLQFRDSEDNVFTPV